MDDGEAGRRWWLLVEERGWSAEGTGKSVKIGERSAVASAFGSLTIKMAGWRPCLS